MKRRNRRRMVRAALVVAAFVSSAETIAQAPPQPDVPAIAVTGSGSVAVAPDQAIVRLGATIEDDDAAAAQQRLNEVLQQALRSIRELGIPAANVQTAGLSLSPVYSDPGAPENARRGDSAPRIVRYRATNVVRVTIDDLSMIGRVIDAGIAAGVNEIRGVSFGLRDELPQRLNALARAVDAATRKARAAADALGVRLGEPIELREQSSVMPYREVDVAFARAGAATAVEPGEIRIEATVDARFRIDASASRSAVD
jgi:uncharacterized protein YggE